MPVALLISLVLRYVLRFVRFARCFNKFNTYAVCISKIIWLLGYIIDLPWVNIFLIYTIADTCNLAHKLGWDVVLTVGVLFFDMLWVLHLNLCVTLKWVAWKVFSFIFWIVRFVFELRFIIMRVFTLMRNLDTCFNFVLFFKDATRASSCWSFFLIKVTH